MTTTDRLAEIEARLFAATPGPWENEGGGEIGQHYTCPPPYRTVIGTEVSCSSYCYGGSTKGVEREADADLIAHAPTDLAALVAVVREVEALHHVEHHPARAAIMHGGDELAMAIPARDVCAHDGGRWPCPTATAVQKLGGGS